MWFSVSLLSKRNFAFLETHRASGPLKKETPRSLWASQQSRSRDVYTLFRLRSLQFWQPRNRFLSQNGDPSCVIAIAFAIMPGLELSAERNFRSQRVTTGSRFRIKHVSHFSRHQNPGDSQTKCSSVAGKAFLIKLVVLHSHFPRHETVFERKSFDSRLLAIYSLRNAVSGHPTVDAIRG